MSAELLKIQFGFGVTMNLNITPHVKCIACSTRVSQATRPKKLLDTFARLSADVRKLKASQQMLRKALTAARLRADYSCGGPTRPNYRHERDMCA